ncbi:TonB family protein [Sphingobium sp. H33]|uniref:Protein TonB n=2 Tax=Sphingobium nicotianae TaxID=2782607 RepID=A0A9X1DEK7_9SPHN|nr:TonB family protein [Sphingobium nicotianae]
MTFVSPPKTPPLPTHWVYLPKNPPPVDQPETKEKPQPTQRAISDPPPPQPTTTSTPFDQFRAGPEVAPYTPPLIPGTGTVTPPYVPPADPVFVKARQDPRFAAAFHPNYPPSLVRDGLEGDVTVRVTIDPRGRVSAVEMVSATNPVFFEETKRQALRSWRFIAATRDGVAVESVQTMTVHFRLEE